MRRMTRFKRAGQGLGREETKMRLNWEYSGFGVKVLNGSQRVTACNETQRPVLDQLQPVERRLGIQRKNHRGRVIGKRADDGFECCRQTLLIVSEA